MTKSTRDILVATLAISAAALSLYFGLANRSPKVNLDTYEVLGAVTAEETLQLLGSKGQVLAIARDTGPDKNPSVEAELEAFQKTLHKNPAITLAVERVQLTPMLMMATGGAVPADQLLKAVHNHPHTGALVLFFAFPVLGDAELETLKASGVKTVVVSSFHPGYDRLLQQQAIHLVIVPRPEPPPPGAQAPRTRREKFDQEFTILRASTN